MRALFGIFDPSLYELIFSRRYPFADTLACAFGSDPFPFLANVLNSAECLTPLMEKYEFSIRYKTTLGFVEVGGLTSLGYKYMRAVPNTTLANPNTTCGYPRDDALHIFG